MEAAQKLIYRRAVEFSTLASNMSPEEVKQKEAWVVVMLTESPFVCVWAGFHQSVNDSSKIEGQR